MKADEKTDIVVRLKSEYQQTRLDIERLEELCQPIAPDNAIGRLTRLDAMNNRAVNEAALDAALTKISKLRSALARVDSNTFGRCRKCDLEIEYARLKLMPETDTCMVCARKR